MNCIEVTVDLSLVSLWLSDVVEAAVEVLRVGDPENTIVMFAAAVEVEAPLELVTLLLATLALALSAADTDVMLPTGVSCAEDGTAVSSCVMVLRLSGAGAFTV